ncbi:hypothetical protein CVT25_012979 [Psilocybe cyanescens]|uniref:Uncharacterized protein n=1 Tax=Psilocybe cyanescens TaxID=93625 RepID=A0A409X7H3_PSICY|nr:hypothetical protein CVT25_012979 [Psilocybe cyanescens]
MQPILDSICQSTGWKATLLTGGPEPAHDGLMNVISIHSGFTTGDIKMNFGHAERLRIQNYILPIFGSFLQKSPEECKARVLSKDKGFLPLSLSPDLDDNATIHSIELSASFRDILMPAASTSTEPAPMMSSTTSIPMSQVATNNDTSNPFPHNWKPYTFDDNDSFRSASPVGPGSFCHSPPPSPARSDVEPHSDVPTTILSQLPANGDNANRPVLDDPPAPPSQIPKVGVKVGVRFPYQPSLRLSDQPPIVNSDTAPSVASLPPRPSHPSIVVSDTADISPSAPPAAPSTGKASTKTKAAAKAKRKDNENGNNIPKKRQKGAKSSSAEKPEVIPTTTRRSTRSTGNSDPATKTPSSAPIPVEESTIILRSGKPAKPSKFWTYV